MTGCPFRQVDLASWGERCNVLALNHNHRDSNKQDARTLSTGGSLFLRFIKGSVSGRHPARRYLDPNLHAIQPYIKPVRMPGPPNRKKRREQARHDRSAQTKVKGNGHEFRHERLQRKREQRGLAEEQRAERRIRLARENGETTTARLYAALQRLKASMKMGNLEDLRLAFGLVVFGIVAAVVMWLNVSEI